MTVSIHGNSCGESYSSAGLNGAGGKSRDQDGTAAFDACMKGTSRKSGSEAGERRSSHGPNGRRDSGPQDGQNAQGKNTQDKQESDGAQTRHGNRDGGAERSRNRQSGEGDGTNGSNAGTQGSDNQGDSGAYANDSSSHAQNHGGSRGHGDKASGGGFRNDLMQAADTNGDGRVSRSELRSFFRNADTNHDGKLSGNELRQALADAADAGRDDWANNSGDACEAAAQETNGGSGDDRISGGRGDDAINGGRGDDKLSGGRGDDTLNGGRGDDRLAGGRGDDVLNGGRGDDTLEGGRGDDTLNGGKGDDVLAGGRGDDVLDGGAGHDTARFDGNYSDYTISNKDGTTTVVRGGNTTTLKNIEDMQFRDKTVATGPGPSPFKTCDVKDGKGSVEWGDYKLSLDEGGQQWNLTNTRTGDATRVWGDPHVDVGANGTNDWDFKQNMSFQLADGTKITVGTVDGAGQAVNGQTAGASYSSQLTITRGDHAVTVSGLAGSADGANNLKVTQSTDGKALDARTADGAITVHESAGGWSAQGGGAVTQQAITAAEHKAA